MKILSIIKLNVTAKCIYLLVWFIFCTKLSNKNDFWFRSFLLIHQSIANSILNTRCVVWKALKASKAIELLKLFLLWPKFNVVALANSNFIVKIIVSVFVTSIFQIQNACDNRQILTWHTIYQASQILNGFYAISLKTVKHLHFE